MSDDAFELNHGIKENGAFYTWVGPGLLWPHLICICGFKARAASWEEAGAELDEHLAPFKKEDE